MTFTLPGRVSGLLLVLVAAVLPIDRAAAAPALPFIHLVGRECTFLPEGPMPAWIRTRPNMPGMHVGIGQAGQLTTPEAQIHAAESDALDSLASEIEVRIKSNLVVVETQDGKSANTFANSKTESGIQQLLRDAEIQERWLDRANCMVWALATVSEASVEKVRLEIQKELDKRFTSKKVMIFDVSGGQVDMAGFLLRDMERVFRELGVSLVSPDNRLASCTQETSQQECLKLQDTIYAGFSVAFVHEELSTDKQLKGRFYRVKGAMRFQDRLVSSFDITCRGVGYADEDNLSIDRAAASECVTKASKILQEDMQKSE
jgi:LPP20 lipoprotein